jgi:hypothetical protein
LHRQEDGQHQLALAHGIHPRYLMDGLARPGLFPLLNNLFSNFLLAHSRVAALHT